MSKTANQQKDGKVRNQVSPHGETYHGTRMVAPKPTERFTVSEIRRAVDAAIEKNRDILAKRK